MIDEFNCEALAEECFLTIEKLLLEPRQEVRVKEANEYMGKDYPPGLAELMFIDDVLDEQIMINDDDSTFDEEVRDIFNKKYGPKVKAMLTALGIEEQGRGYARIEA